MNIMTRHLPSIADRTHGDEGLIEIDDAGGDFLCKVCQEQPVEYDDEICEHCTETEIDYEPEAA